MYWLVACVGQIAEDIAKLPDNLSLVVLCNRNFIS